MNQNRPAAMRILLPFILLFTVPVSAQTLLQTLETYNRDFPEEKIHIHFDKPGYAAGETIWFKAYLQHHNFPSDASSNLYTELLDTKGKLLQRKVLPVYEGSAAGSFDLPAPLTGTFLFRAYTSWMLNSDTAFLFGKYITITGASDTPPAASPAGNVQVRFLPEGGDWLVDFESVLAFKATDANGRPVKVSGSVRNGKGVTVGSFTSFHDGMGKVNITPEAGETYTAYWKTPTTEGMTPLPKPADKGVLLAAQQHPSYLTYIIRGTEGNVPEQLKVHLLATMHQQVLYRATTSLAQTNITSGIIKYDGLTTGLLTLTLFDSNWKPLAERLVFIDKNDGAFPAAVHIKQKDLSKRGYNTIEVEVPDSLLANLSIAVTDGAIREGRNDASIFSNLLLGSHLRGYIHEPGYYFSNRTDSVKQALDLLLLTHGWRRYNWDALAKGKLPQIRFPKDQYLTVQGNLFGFRPGEIKAGTQLNMILQTKDSARRILTAPVDSEGRFSIRGLFFFDTARLYYSFNKDNKLARFVSVSLKPETLQRQLTGIDAEWVARAAIAELPENRSRFFAARRAEVLPIVQRQAGMLEEVIVRSKLRSREEQLEKKYVSGLFQSGSSHNFNLIDDPSAESSINVFQYLEGRVAGLVIHGSGTEYTVTRRDTRPELYIDEMPADLDQLAALSMSTVAYIKVIDPPFIGGTGNGPGGAISIYTKRGAEYQNNNVKGMEHEKISGYARVKEFYSPDYSIDAPLHKFEDVRSTLYWNPFVLTSKNKQKVTISFYNNDLSSSLRVVMEGMNERGKLTRVEKVIQ